jgi:hypothetical protein
MWWGWVVGKEAMTAVSLDRFVADEQDGVGPLFDWFGNGDAACRFRDRYQGRSRQASVAFPREQYRDIGAVVVEGRGFDLTSRWNGKPSWGSGG